MITLTDQFIQSLMDIQKEDIPVAILEKAKLCLLDYLAVTCAGNITLQEEMKELDIHAYDHGNSTIIGRGCNYSMMQAALVNGYASHYLELDDGHRKGMIHLGAGIISSILLIAEVEKWDNQKILKAIIISYEAAIRLSKTMQPSHKMIGYHTSATVGSIAAILGIVIVQDRGFDAVKRAFCCGCTSAAGILRVQDDSSQLKPFNIAQSVLNTVSCVYTSYVPLRSVDDVLDGKKGFFDIYAKVDDYEGLIRQAYEPFLITTIYTKPYPSCRHCHSPYEASLHIKSLGVSADEIETVRVGIYRLAIAGHDHNDIQGINSAKLSIPYNVALGLSIGANNLQQYSLESVQDPKLLDLCKKVEVYEDIQLTGLCPEKRAAKVSVTLKDGTCISKRVDYPKGEPENDLSKEEFIEKYVGLLQAVGFSKEKAYALYQKGMSDEVNYIEYMQELKGA